MCALQETLVSYRQRTEIAENQTQNLITPLDELQQKLNSHSCRLSADKVRHQLQKRERIGIYELGWGQERRPWWSWVHWAPKFWSLLCQWMRFSQPKWQQKPYPSGTGLFEGINLTLPEETVTPLAPGSCHARLRWFSSGSTPTTPLDSRLITRFKFSQNCKDDVQCVTHEECITLQEMLLEFPNLYRQKSIGTRERIYIKGVGSHSKEHKVDQGKFIDMNFLCRDSAFNVATQESKSVLTVWLLSCWNTDQIMAHREQTRTCPGLL